MNSYGMPLSDCPHNCEFNARICIHKIDSIQKSVRFGRHLNNYHNCSLSTHIHTVGGKNVPEPFEGGSAVLHPDEHSVRADIFRPDHYGCILSPNLPESLTTAFEGYVNRASEPRFYMRQ
jgi:hypothetical protein